MAADIINLMKQVWLRGARAMEADFTFALSLSH